MRSRTCESYSTVRCTVRSSAPIGTPAAIIAQLQKSIVAGLTAGPAPEKLRDMGSEIATPEQMTPDGFAKFIRVDYDNMGEAAKLAGLTPK